MKRIAQLTGAVCVVLAFWAVASQPTRGRGTLVDDDQAKQIFGAQQCPNDVQNQIAACGGPCTMGGGNNKSDNVVKGNTVANAPQIPLPTCNCGAGSYIMYPVCSQ